MKVFISITRQRYLSRQECTGDAELCFGSRTVTCRIFSLSFTPRCALEQSAFCLWLLQWLSTTTTTRNKITHNKRYSFAAVKVTFGVISCQGWSLLSLLWSRAALRARGRCTFPVTAPAAAPVQSQAAAQTPEGRELQRVVSERASQGSKCSERSAAWVGQGPAAFIHNAPQRITQ